MSPEIGGKSVAVADQIWLRRIGVGPTQTARVCGRGARDPVAKALCSTPAPALGGLEDLYRTLGMVATRTERLVAAATHSLGLSGRIVSALNPRTFVFRSYTSLDEASIVAVASSRGERVIELVGFDPVARDFNFYLLAFEQPCDADGCKTSDLLTSKVETGWTGFTLYGDVDLEDTGLNCLSCHRPDGVAAPKRLLMRQLADPWMHWGDFRGVSGSLFCDDAPDPRIPVDGNVTAEGLDLLMRVDGLDGRHGGIPVADLIKAPSGYDFSSFLFYAVGLADGPGDVPCEAPACVFWEPHVFDSRAVICDRLLRGSADVPGGDWDRYRDQTLSLGFPVPYHGPDVLDPGKRDQAAADFPAFLNQLDQLDRNAGTETFALMANMMSADAARAVGFVPSEADTAPRILQQMCVRCHAATTDPKLARARFNAEALDSLGPETARKIIERITLPRTSADLMPPQRAGELPPWAIERVRAWLGGR